MSKRVNYVIVPILKGKRITEYTYEELLELKKKYEVIREETMDEGLYSFNKMYKGRIRLIDDELFRRGLL